MASPLPGMDPFIEASGLWPDFHATFIGAWREALAERLPPQYEARLDERVQLIDVSGRPVRLYRPDVAVTRQPTGGGTTSTSHPGTATLEPIPIPFGDTVIEEVRETRIQVLHRTSRSLVTVLELLSPANKQPGIEREDYHRKRKRLLQHGVSLVELDLLLGGEHPPLSEPLPPGDFFAMVTRAWRSPLMTDVYAWTLRQPFPELRVPLREADLEVALPLADVYRITCERGRYSDSIDYGDVSALPLGLPDVDWIRQLTSPPPPAAE